MHILLISIGTGGDTLPFIAWGQVLQSRGHEVTVLANGAYHKVANERGVPFVELITSAEHERRCAVRDKSPREWRRSSIENMLADVRTAYERIGQLRRPETVMAASTLCMGARLAQEQWGIPLATVSYSQLLFSMTDPSTWIGRRSRWLQATAKFLVYRLGDRALKSRLNTLRQEFGLPPLVKPVLQWWHSPDGIIGFFPEWFAAPQADWPANVTPAGFAVSDVSTEPPLGSAVESFLNAGPPPIVFSYSTALNASVPFYREAIQIAKKLNQRAILLSAPAELTRDLPPNILAAPATSHLRLFPHARMAVHHAGIGSTAAALLSGIPQFHVPYSMDQPDNAKRCEKLGISKWVKLSKFRAERALPQVERLLSDPAVSQRCRDFANRHGSYAGLERASEVLERLKPANRS